VIGPDHFELDGAPHRVVAGALHYFRVHPDQWADRIHKARLMGLNTVETYVAWNAHSPRRGDFDTSAGLDLGRFLDLVAAEGMHAIVRPGPYICAEWDGGGLPGWLFDDPAVGVRRSEPLWLAAVDEFLEHVYEIVVPRQIDHGGPVVLVQIENEYGAYGDDSGYLRHLVDLTRASGVVVPLTTVDQPTDEMLSAGSLPELHATGSFGSRAEERLATLRRHQPTGPLMCSEFWDGWFDHWGEHHHTTPVEEAARELDALLTAGASVNIYMFHGGTNFGFTNGANHKGTYQSHVTSYDYDAPLDEAGWPTEKFFAFRDVIARHLPVPDEVPARRSPSPVLSTTFDRSVRLGDVVGDLGTDGVGGDPGVGVGASGWIGTEDVPTMDALGSYRGFALHRVDLPAGDEPRVLSFAGVRDRAVVSVDGRRVGVLQRDQHERAITVPPGRVLEVLVEDQGRVNYGVRIGEAKGLVGPALLDGAELTGWRSTPLDLGAVVATLSGDATESGGTPVSGDAPQSGGAADASSGSASDSAVTALDGPEFAHATVTLDAPTDLFLDTRSWGKGVAFVNGFALGRYWTRGPQHTLYVPGEQLRAGENDLVVFETGAAAAPIVSFVADPDLGHTEQ
jgi:beta-galactosidase